MNANLPPGAYTIQNPAYDHAYSTSSTVSSRKTGTKSPRNWRLNSSRVSVMSWSSRSTCQSSRAQNRISWQRQSSIQAYSTPSCTYSRQSERWYRCSTSHQNNVTNSYRLSPILCWTTCRKICGQPRVHRTSCQFSKSIITSWPWETLPRASPTSPHPYQKVTCCLPWRSSRRLPKLSWFH